ncbi:MAG: hypothetical protein ABMB14_27350, partial [Myxococcota bacterium]
MPDKSKRKAAPGNRSRIEEYHDLVGVLTDPEVAAKAGVTPSAVHQYRQRHGIAPALPQGATRRALERRKARESGESDDLPPEPGGDAPTAASASSKGRKENKPRKSRIDRYRDIVGVLSDAEVATKAGVARTAVQMYRKKHGIPPATPRGKSRPTAPAAATPATKAQPAQARPPMPPPPRRANGTAAGAMYGWRVTFADDAGGPRIALAPNAA